MPRRSLTLILLGSVIVLLGAAGGLVAWHPWQRAPEASAPAGPAPVVVSLSEFDQDLLRSVQLVSAAGTIELDDVEGTWKIVKPAALAVKEGPMADLLYSLTNLWSERIVDEHPTDLAQYGLAAPAVTVRMTLSNGETPELLLGDLTPAGDSYYLMKKGDPRVFTVREHNGTFFHYGVRELWGGGFKPIDGNDLVYLRLRRSGRTIVQLERTPELFKDDVEFRATTISVVYPYTAAPKPADLSFIDMLAQGFTSLAGTVAIDAGPRDLSRYGLGAPAGELEMRDGKGGTLHFTMGTVEGSVLFIRFAGDPTVYGADPNLLSVLDLQPFQFIGKNAAIVKLDKVEALTLEQGGTRHVLQVKRVTPGSEVGAQWLVDGRTVAEKAFKDFYVTAVSLQIDALRDHAVSGAADVTVTFTLNTGGARAFVVRFVPYSQEFYAVLKNGLGDGLVNRQQVKVLLQKLDELLSTAAKGS